LTTPALKYLPSSLKAKAVWFIVKWTKQDHQPLVLFHMSDGFNPRSSVIKIQHSVLVDNHERVLKSFIRHTKREWGDSPTNTLTETDRLNAAGIHDLSLHRTSLPKMLPLGLRTSWCWTKARRSFKRSEWRRLHGAQRVQRS
jgi:hypothetical protein